MKKLTAAEPANPWPTFVVCAIAAYIATLDMSIVNVAFAEIARSFPGSSRGTISWVVTAYSILFGSLLVVSGRSADRVGRRRLLLIGTGLFLAGSLACAVSPGLGLLVAGRAVQGVGGALLVPSSLGLLLAAFPDTRRSQAIAWNGAVGALGVASGPTLGALCVAAFGWRSAFWINVPICLVVAALAWRMVPDSPRVAGPRPDVAASVVLTVSVASLVWAISRAETLGWGDRSVIGLLALAAVFGAVVAQRSRRHPRPLLPPSLFTRRTATAANLATVVFGIAFSANLLNNVLFLRTVWRYGVVRAGLFSVLAPVVVAVTSVVAGRLMRRVGFRPLLLAGPLGIALVAVGQARLLTESPTPVTRWLPLMFLLGVGIGSTFPVLAAASVHGLPPEHFALGGAVNNTARQVGAAVGVALVVTIQGTADGIAGFRAGWLFVAACCGLAAAVSLAQPRPVRAASPAPVALAVSALDG
ncbi:MAG: MFS transporter [Acidimicrobiales bacterium]